MMKVPELSDEEKQKRKLLADSRKQRQLTRNLHDAQDRLNRYRRNVRTWFGITGILGSLMAAGLFIPLWIPVLPGYGMFGVNAVFVILFLISAITTLFVAYPEDRFGKIPDFERSIRDAQDALDDFYMESSM